MELGVALPTSGRLASPGNIVRIAQEAERLGYASVWTYERLLRPVAELPAPDGSMRRIPAQYRLTYEPLETLSYVAALTERVRLGTSVIDALLHPPVVLARRFATLDQFSGGRVVAGLGQGWMPQEFETANVPMDRIGSGMDEVVAAMRACWGPDPVEFEGRFYRIAPSEVNPKPVQERIPVLLGATTPAGARRAGRIADGLNPIAFSAEVVPALAATLAMLLRLLPRGGEPVRPSGLYRYSLPMSLNRLILYANNQTEVLVLGLLQAAGPVGVFGVTRRLSMLLASLLTSISVLLIPLVADLHHRREQSELDRLFLTASRWLFTVGFPLCLVEILFGPELLTLFGASFSSGAAALAILALGQLVNVGTGTVASVLAIIGRTRLSVLDSVLFLGLSLGLDFLLIPRWSIVGAAVANACALAAVNLLRVVQVHRAIGLLPWDRRFLRPLAAGLVAGAVAWLLPLASLDPIPRLGLHVVTLGLVYAGLLLAFGIDPGDRAVAAAFRSSIASRASRARSSGGGAHVGHEQDP
mgnify:CR=1 FL=1